MPANAPAAQAERESDPLRQALDGIDPDQLTPRQALDALYGLVAMASEAE